MKPSIFQGIKMFLVFLLKTFDKVTCLLEESAMFQPLVLPAPAGPKLLTARVYWRNQSERKTNRVVFALGVELVERMKWKAGDWIRMSLDIEDRRLLFELAPADAADIDRRNDRQLCIRRRSSRVPVAAMTLTWPMAGILEETFPKNNQKMECDVVSFGIPEVLPSGETPKLMLKYSPKLVVTDIRRPHRAANAAKPVRGPSKSTAFLA